jgi:AcrR family transcriptional regulator
LFHILNMRSSSRQHRQPSFIEEARRKQIVDTAIRTIAARGYSGTSLAEIAREAGISKGVISYHFEGKGELIEEILTRLMREPAEFIKKRVDACERAGDKLRAYVAATFEFAKSHRNELLALVDLWGRRISSEGRNRFDAEAYEPSRHYLSRIVESGVASGELGHVPLPTMASVMQATIDGVLLQWAFDDNAVDLDACRDEIQNMISRHVRERSRDECGS